MRWKFLYMVGALLGFAFIKGIQILCFTFYRSPEDQLKEYMSGKSRTKIGKHPYWLAIDLAVVDDVDHDLVVDKD